MKLAAFDPLSPWRKNVKREGKKKSAGWSVILKEKKLHDVPGMEMKRRPQNVHGWFQSVFFVLKSSSFKFQSFVKACDNELKVFVSFQRFCCEVWRDETEINRLGEGEKRSFWTPWACWWPSCGACSGTRSTRYSSWGWTTRARRRSCTSSCWTRSSTRRRRSGRTWRRSCGRTYTFWCGTLAGRSRCGRRGTPTTPIPSSWYWSLIRPTGNECRSAILETVEEFCHTISSFEATSTSSFFLFTIQTFISFHPWKFVNYCISP